ncbi:hypothetical protein CHS0354_010710 [Potamilus streckersoni]|uniref:Uncharacterized protein n=1 Tax=Potamilus streckersoni TaxID=2493646 RepID=A0AAE0W028_9BIVA|nr:hypothetical protein CHS0354_010710 [Potamilus streckersoni]
MDVLELYPSEIRFSQKAINTMFDRRSLHSYRSIGQTLDDLCEGRCKISDIPRISVCQHDGEWYTKDNRRLWVFKQLEALGNCGKITVNVVQKSEIDSRKFSTENNGRSVEFIKLRSSSPGGDQHHITTLFDTPPPNETSTLLIQPTPNETSTLLIQPTPNEISTLLIQPTPNEISTLLIQPTPNETSTLLIQPTPNETSTLLIQPTPNEITRCDTPSPMKQALLDNQHKRKHTLFRHHTK